MILQKQEQNAATLLTALRNQTTRRIVLVFVFSVHSLSATNVGENDSKYSTAREQPLNIRLKQQYTGLSHIHVIFELLKCQFGTTVSMASC